MNVALLVLRLLLAVVFATAAAAKLTDRAGARRAVRDFGVPAALVPAVAVCLPVVELAIALALLPLTSAWWAATGALVLLLVFVVAIAANLMRGNRPECRCFGQLSSKPLGWRTLGRTGLLAAVAAMVVVAGRGSAGASVAEAWTVPDPMVRGSGCGRCVDPRSAGGPWLAGAPHGPAER
jgi:hypothetical protein